MADSRLRILAISLAPVAGAVVQTLLSEWVLFGSALDLAGVLTHLIGTFLIGYIAILLLTLLVGWGMHVWSCGATIHLFWILGAATGAMVGFASNFAALWAINEQLLPDLTLQKAVIGSAGAGARSAMAGAVTGLIAWLILGRHAPPTQASSTP